MSGARRAGESKLELRLLGPLEVSTGGRVLPIGGPKPRTLLAVLALEAGRVVSVDRLVEDLWPAEPPKTAPHTIQVYVSQLRKALGNEAISTHAPGYMLELEPEQVDLHRFVRLADEGRAALAEGDAVMAEVALREALGLWRGAALADFTYELFAQGEIARLEELRLVALEARLEADLALGRHADLVSELEALADAQPLRERPRAQLMLALYRSGRQAEALAAYRAARETLVEELGIDPGPGLRELEAAILRQDESLLLPEAAPAPAMQFRRLVTILFVDVVESMALATALDPEALGSVLRRYFETVSSALTRHGGTVEKSAGDAVMAAFGVPVAHEDDAVRAARAAVDIRTTIAALNEQLEREHGLGIQVRIGLETGEVVATETDARQRLMTGEAVGVAAKLAAEAGAGEIVVGELAGRLIDHVGELESLGEIAIKGKREPVRAYRLVDVAQVAPAFAGRLDAQLVGRKRELAAVRKELRLAVEQSAVRVALVAGPPGVGKSRLAAEFTRRAKGVTSLWGRCLSYGEGITYWPLREIVGRARPSAERNAVLTALDADTPPSAAEIALLFRQLCEALARERPLVVVFDDVHWAEPTLLELVEHLADRGSEPILVVCIAREELFEERPEFLDGRDNVARLELEALSVDETDALLDGLGGSILESEQRESIVEAAEGNPFFLEQLIALAVEGGLAERALPATVQALLAARLDRLGPGERAVLERAAVIGKQFRLDDVVALLEPEAAPTVDAHMRTLVTGGFVRPVEGGELRFRHLLVREAVYRAAPKRLRADLHERFTGRFEDRGGASGDVDEFAGYHLEQAFRLRTELGESDRHAAQLAKDAGRRLGAAGFRALKRGDMPATVGLLDRAISLLPRGEEARSELMCELAIAQLAVGDGEVAGATLDNAIAEAAAAGQRRAELRARIEWAYMRLLTEPEGAARELLALVEAAVPTFEALGDDRSLARAWLLAGYVRGGIHGNHAAWEEAEERALGYYRRTAFPPATCLGQIAAAIYWGPTPVPSGIEKCTKLLADETIGYFGRATVLPFLGGLHAQAGRFSDARALVAEAEDTYEELGAAATAAISGTVRADVELLAADLPAAETTLREQCEFFDRVNDRSHLAVRAAKLAEAIYRQGRFDEAQDWAIVSRANAASDDLSVQLTLGIVEAKLLARRGSIAEARNLAEETVRLADGTDGLNQIAASRLALGDVLRAAELPGEAQRAIEAAVELFERKGNTVGASQARDLLDLEVPA